jgi:hypothetical protein
VRPEQNISSSQFYFARPDLINAGRTLFGYASEGAGDGRPLARDSERPRMAEVELERQDWRR